MANFQHIWGPSRKEWRPVDLQAKQVSSALLVSAWAGMVAFFIFAAFSVLTGTDWAAVLMIAALLLWVTSGIAIIRIRRTHKKQVIFDG